MSESRTRLKQRLQEAGVWKEYLALRDQLVREGKTPAEAREEALAEIDARLQEPATPPVPEEPPVEYEPPPTCERCQRIFSGPGCPNCFRAHGTVETLRAAGLVAEAAWLEGWVEKHQNAPPPASKWMTDAEREVVARLPPEMFVDCRLIYRGRVTRGGASTSAPGNSGTTTGSRACAKPTPGQRALMSLLERQPLKFLDQLHAFERDWSERWAKLESSHRSEQFDASDEVDEGSERVEALIERLLREAAS